MHCSTHTKLGCICIWIYPVNKAIERQRSLCAADVHAAGVEVEERVAVLVEEVGDDLAVVGPVEEELLAGDGVVVPQGDGNVLRSLPAIDTQRSLRAADVHAA